MANERLNGGFAAANHIGAREIFGRTSGTDNVTGAVVLIHPTNVPALLPLINQYPNMKLILAHLHNDEDTDAILLVQIPISPAFR